STIVIFTSDNGPWLTYGNHAGSAANLREGKATTFEGGVRVPFIARWPGHIPKGSACDGVAALIDLLPTFAEITQSKPSANIIDGKSILPLLLGRSTEGAREMHYYFQINDLQAVRKGKWKLHFPHEYEHVVKAGKDGQRGKTEMIPVELSLFDLGSDPGEKNNLASKYPDVVDELKILGAKFLLEMHQQKRKPGTSKP
ncbi:MAG: N-acetylgalactosamine-6-sulfatase, partial [Marivirga sp.]|nr:N-acetylgalactosamine-6-sulfatase [Marivirga sp.]